MGDFIGRSLWGPYGIPIVSLLCLTKIYYMKTKTYKYVLLYALLFNSTALIWMYIVAYNLLYLEKLFYSIIGIF